jgi:hypothetical protein
LSPQDYDKALWCEWWQFDELLHAFLATTAKGVTKMPKAR